MTEWRSIIGDNPYMTSELDLDETVAALTELLRSPDPATRDVFAYVRLARLVPHLDTDRRLRLGDTLLPALQDEQIQVRTFAPLILASLVNAGSYRPQWLAAFEAWYPNERDLRGHDPELGWLHAVAHGADLLGEFGLCEEVEPAPLLRLAVARLLAPTEYVLRDQEDDRLAHAIATTLTRVELTAEESVGWLGPVEAAFKAGEPGPVPPQATNTMRTLRLLYLLADRGVRPDWGDSPAQQLRHREELKERLAEVLALVAPFAG